MATKYLTKKMYGDKLLDPRWQKKRLEILTDANFTCTYCADKESTLHVHHFCYTANGNPWDSPNDALICLCKKCHELCHIKDLTPFEREIVSQIQMAGTFQSNINPAIAIMVRSITNVILNHKNG